MTTPTSAKPSEPQAESTRPNTGQLGEQPPSATPDFDPRTWRKPRRSTSPLSPLDLLHDQPAPTTPAETAPTAEELSGAHWVAQFPTSTVVAHLETGFQQKVRKFLNALVAAGAVYKIAATYRPAERAYLMHYAWCIAKENLDPRTVPAQAGVNICWLHPEDADLQKSRAAAAAMVAAYDIVYKPSLTSRHIERLAIDINISWEGDLNIVNGFGVTIVINTTPRNGAGNAQLHAVGASYGVYKLVEDPPHWSSDGH